MTMPPKTPPTAEQCSLNTVLEEEEHVVWRACWYPQIGGYVAKAVLRIAKEEGRDGCFDAYLYSDPDFPKNEVRMELHHCRARQFSDFARKVESFQDAASGQPPPTTVDRMPLKRGIVRELSAIIHRVRAAMEGYDMEPEAALRLVDADIDSGRASYKSIEEAAERILKLIRSEP